MTRAVRMLVRGEWRSAYRLHPLVFLVAPALLGWGGFGSICYIRYGTSQREQHGTWRERGVGLLALAMVLVWVARFFGACGGPVQDL
jgi:hypothetical protein